MNHLAIYHHTRRGHDAGSRDLCNIFDFLQFNVHSLLTRYFLDHLNRVLQRVQPVPNTLIFFIPTAFSSAIVLPSQNRVKYKSDQQYPTEHHTNKHGNQT